MNSIGDFQIFDLADIKNNKNLIDEIIKMDQIHMQHPWNESMWGDIVDNGLYKIFVLILDNKLFGFSLYQIVADDFAHLLKIIIKTEIQKKGFGQILLENDLFFLKQQRIPRLYLEVATDNLGAQKLYLKLGFEQIALKKRFYSDGKDAYAMQLKLD